MQKFRIVGKIDGKDLDFLAESWVELLGVLRAAELAIHGNTAIKVEVCND